MRATLTLLILSLSRLEAQESIDRIMETAAANLLKASQTRGAYVYSQKLHTRLLRTNSKVAREERREYLVAPGSEGSEKKLVHFSGHYQKGNELLPYSDPSFRYKESDVDGFFIQILAEGLIDDKKAKDGIDLDPFPFKPQDLQHYNFRLVKTEEYRGRRIHRVAFEPREKTFGHPWAGELLIDAEDLFPMSIQTKLAPKIPLAVRILLGTNLSQTGFSLTYTRLEPGVWFPASYGTEMRLSVLFGYKRVIAMSMESSDFRKVSAVSSIDFERAVP